MVQLIATERIIDALEAIPLQQREELDLPATLEIQGPISHEQLIRLASHLQQNPALSKDTSHTPTVLGSLLCGTKVYVPPPPKKPEPTPEYLASKARLLALTEQESYNRLLNPTYQPNIHDAYATQASGLEEDTLTISLVTSIFISVLVSGFSVYAALTRFPAPAMMASEAVKVLLGLFAGVGVAVAESFLYWSYLGKVERARNKERRVRERKVVIGPVGESEEGGDGDGVEVGGVEKEEIWGKGVNGGVRRRVREKWEKGRDVD
ncbi:uncharacterized protein N7515_006625 [Penicillium bovifimosum]|uniref:ATPase, vacuolar ER assembly factor, Vma12 n=1 Tax=Penicillium bovifimosum TaxID=126998 RepID=A0A9W9GWE6_9EURO|nr:uncharacterized protein N7515_006625 [Penicillium bovifimosum]KAJ5130586.1 hypothetical protein N7515_006625 [Penicillium bovifimosum]